MEGVKRTIDMTATIILNAKTRMATIMASFHSCEMVDFNFGFVLGIERRSIGKYI